MTEYTPADRTLARALKIGDEVALRPSTADESVLVLLDPYRDDTTSSLIEWHPVVGIEAVAPGLQLTFDNDLVFPVLTSTSLWARAAYEPQSTLCAFWVVNPSTGAIIATAAVEATAHTRARSARAWVVAAPVIADYRS